MSFIYFLFITKRKEKYNIFELKWIDVLTKAKLLMFYICKKYHKKQARTEKVVFRWKRARPIVFQGNHQIFFREQWQGLPLRRMRVKLTALRIDTQNSRYPVPAIFETIVIYDAFFPTPHHYIQASFNTTEWLSSKLLIIPSSKKRLIVSEIIVRIFGN